MLAKQAREEEMVFVLEKDGGEEEKGKRKRREEVDLARTGWRFAMSTDTKSLTREYTAHGADYYGDPGTPPFISSH